MVRVIEGDMLTVLGSFETDSIDACVTDPPYGLRFMGKAWDHGVPGVPYWSAVLRVLKPGAFLVAFGGTRTYHRLTCAIEDAGFEIRDCLMWLYGSGFPKGKGCLKPGWEPIVLARKPGPRPWLNVDACRIGTTVETWPISRSYSRHDTGSESKGTQPTGQAPSGRWPANCVLSHEPECRETGTVEIPSRGGATRSSALGRMNDDSWQPSTQDIVRPSPTATAWECVPECAVRLLDAQSGARKSGGGDKGNKTPGEGVFYRAHKRQWASAEYAPDTGGVSRFFYCSKASPSERGAFNDWPTVKPLALMRWLIRLVTPPGGTLVDPFCGSGSTLLAAALEGFEAIGIDRDPHAVEISRLRLAEQAGPLFSGIALEQS